jgi:hypothetical protein
MFVLGGIRCWHLKTDVIFNAGLVSTVTAPLSKGWVDGVAGIRGRTHFTPLFLTGKADLGGGGSNFSYQLLGGLVGKRHALIAGYRDLDVKYNKDGFSLTMRSMVRYWTSGSSSNRAIHRLRG